MECFYIGLADNSVMEPMTEGYSTERYTHLAAARFVILVNPVERVFAEWGR